MVYPVTKSETNRTLATDKIMYDKKCASTFGTYAMKDLILLGIDHKDSLETNKKCDTTPFPTYLASRKRAGIGSFNESLESLVLRKREWCYY